MKRIVLTIVAALCVASSRGEAEPCARIVSLAPSVTEVIFDLGLGDNLVGVTRYCRYPTEAQAIAKVGGFYDMSLENLLALKPTYVFGLRENAEIRNSATKFGVPSQEVDHTTIAGIKKSIETIAAVCGVAERARAKLAHLEQREQAIRAEMRDYPPYKTLVIVGRMHEGDALSGVYVSGKDGFYSGVVEILGLRNVNSNATVAIPTLSPEGLLALAPEVIVEIVNTDDPESPADEVSLWKRYGTLPAVRDGRIYVFRQDYASIPGPRYIVLVEEFARRLRKQGGI
jgi:iron complex transport system substrate-binding protein